MKHLFLLLSVLLSGCASVVLPPKTPNTAFQVTEPVRVEPYRYPAYRESLHEALERSEVFSEVRSGDAPGSAPYLAKVHRQVHGSAVIPLLTFVSLGLIPTVTEEEFGESFHLVHDGKTHEIEATWKGRSVLGWVALILNVSPDRSARNPEETPRFASFLRSKLREALQ